MPKNIVICCHGTGNEFGDSNSNVVKLYSTLIIDGKQQVGYYHPGVGTMGAPTALRGPNYLGESARNQNQGQGAITRHNNR